MFNVNVTGKGLMRNAFPYVLPHSQPILISHGKSGHHLKTMCSVYEPVLYVQFQGLRPVIWKNVSGEKLPHIIRPIIKSLSTKFPNKLEIPESGFAWQNKKSKKAIIQSKMYR